MYIYEIIYNYQCNYIVIWNIIILNISNTNTQFVDYPAETENKTKTAPNVQIVDENFKVSPKIDAGSIHIGPLVKE